MITLPPYVEVLSSPDDDKEQWLKDRHDMFTATDAANLLGVGDGSRTEAIKNKAGRVGSDPRLRELSMVVAGNYFEPSIINWYAAESPLPVERYGRLLRHKHFPFMGATPDAFVVGGKLAPLECKNVSFDSGWTWHYGSQDKHDSYLKIGVGEYPMPDDVNVRCIPITKTVAKNAVGAKRLFREWMVEFYANVLPRCGPLAVPVKYYMQLQHQMAVLGSDHGHVVCVLGGVNRFDFTYRRNTLLIEKLREECETAWSEVRIIRRKLDNE